MSDDIVKRLEAAMRVTGYGLHAQAREEILRLRAALAAKQEQCAKVADDFNKSAQDGIAMLKSVGCADITGRHDAFGLASRNIAIAIRALPVEGE